MENIPQPVFLEREESDKKRADELSKVVPLILDKNGFKSVYSDNEGVIFIYFSELRRK